MEIMVLLVISSFVLLSSVLGDTFFGKLSLKTPTDGKRHSVFEKQPFVFATRRSTYLKKYGDVFKIHLPGIAANQGDPDKNSVSFESVRFPGYFLSHDTSGEKNVFRIAKKTVIQENPDNSSFDNSATFIVERRAGIEGSGMLRLFHSPNLYLCIGRSNFADSALQALVNDNGNEADFKHRCSFFIQKLKEDKIEEAVIRSKTENSGSSNVYSHESEPSQEKPILKTADDGTVNKMLMDFNKKLQQEHHEINNKPLVLKSKSQNSIEHKSEWKIPVTTKSAAVDVNKVKTNSESQTKPILKAGKTTGTAGKFSNNNVLANSNQNLIPNLGDTSTTSPYNTGGSNLYNIYANTIYNPNSARYTGSFYNMPQYPQTNENYGTNSYMSHPQTGYGQGLSKNEGQNFQIYNPIKSGKTLKAKNKLPIVINSVKSIKTLRKNLMKSNRIKVIGPKKPVNLHNFTVTHNHREPSLNIDGLMSRVKVPVTRSKISDRVNGTSNATQTTKLNDTRLYDNIFYLINNVTENHVTQELNKNTSHNNNMTIDPVFEIPGNNNTTTTLSEVNTTTSTNITNTQYNSTATGNDTLSMLNNTNVTTSNVTDVNGTNTNIGNESSGFNMTNDGMIMNGGNITSIQNKNETLNSTNQQDISASKKNLLLKAAQLNDIKEDLSGNFTRKSSNHSKLTNASEVMLKNNNNSFALNQTMDSPFVIKNGTTALSFTDRNDTSIHNSSKPVIKYQMKSTKKENLLTTPLNTTTTNFNGSVTNVTKPINGTITKDTNQILQSENLLPSTSVNLNDTQTIQKKNVSQPENNILNRPANSTVLRNPNENINYTVGVPPLENGHSPANLLNEGTIENQLNQQALASEEKELGQPIDPPTPALINEKESRQPQGLPNPLQNDIKISSANIQRDPKEEENARLLNSVFPHPHRLMKTDYFLNPQKDGPLHELPISNNHMTLPSLLSVKPILANNDQSIPAGMTSEEPNLDLLKDGNNFLYNNNKLIEKTNDMDRAEMSGISTAMEKIGQNDLSLMNSQMNALEKQSEPKGMSINDELLSQSRPELNGVGEPQLNFNNITNAPENINGTTGQEEQEDLAFKESIPAMNGTNTSDDTGGYSLPSTSLNDAEDDGNVATTNPAEPSQQNPLNRMVNQTSDDSFGPTNGYTRSHLHKHASKKLSVHPQASGLQPVTIHATVLGTTRDNVQHIFRNDHEHGRFNEGVDYHGGSNHFNNPYDYVNIDPMSPPESNTHKDNAFAYAHHYGDNSHIGAHNVEHGRHELGEHNHYGDNDHYYGDNTIDHLNHNMLDYMHEPDHRYDNHEIDNPLNVAIHNLDHHLITNQDYEIHPLVSSPHAHAHGTTLYESEHYIPAKSNDNLLDDEDGGSPHVMSDETNVVHHTHHVVTVKSEAEKQKMVHGLVDAQTDKCVSLQIVNDINRRYRLISSINKHGYTPRGKLFTLKTVFKDPSAHKFVLFQATDELEPADTLLINGKKKLVAVPTSCDQPGQIVHVTHVNQHPSVVGCGSSGDHNCITKKDIITSYDPTDIYSSYERYKQIQNDIQKRSEIKHHQDCRRTFGGSNRGSFSCCVFPFVFNGVTYKDCIMSSGAGRRSWCGLTSNVDRDKKWAMCMAAPSSNTNTNRRTWCPSYCTQQCLPSCPWNCCLYG